MGLGQSSKAPVTDDTDEGECAAVFSSLFLSCGSEDKRTKNKSFGLFSAPWIGCNKNQANVFDVDARPVGNKKVGDSLHRSLSSEASCQILKPTADQTLTAPLVRFSL